MKLNDASGAVNAALDLDIAAMLWGKPGIGKSEMVAQVAKARGAALLDIRLNLFESVDLRGLPAVVDGATVWLKPGIWPVDENRETVLFFDEIDRAAPSVMSAAMQIVLDRRIGEHVLPASVRILAAGNGKTDRTGTNKMPLALANRLCHFDVEEDFDAWKAWAIGADINPALVAFLNFRPGLLVTESTDGHTVATPRQWVELGRALGQPDSIRRAIGKGLVGEAPAGEFEAFYAIASRLPTIASIIADPAGAMVPGDASGRYAVASGLARKTDTLNFGAVVTYAQRLPKEFEILTVVDAVKRFPGLTQTPAFTSWAINNQEVTL